MVAFIEAFRDQFGVGPICRALRQAGVAISPSGYYAARARPPPARAVHDAALEKEILRVYKDSRERYGAWKVWDQLNREGIAAARCTVERLMRKLGLRGVRRGGWKKPRTTVADPSQDRPADLVNRDFAPPAPDRLWVVDFTFVATRAGTAYTAFVIDAFARLIAGWRTAACHDTGLVLDALVMAVTYRARQGVKVAGLIHHSDAGSEYLSIRYGAELAAAGIAPSVGSVGDSYDKTWASYCTSWCVCGVNSPGELAALGRLTRPGVGGVGRVEQGHVPVVGLAGGEQAGAAPGLDGGDVHAEAVGGLGHGEQAAGAQPVGVAGKVAVAA